MLGNLQFLACGRKAAAPSTLGEGLHAAAEHNSHGQEIIFQDTHGATVLLWKLITIIEDPLQVLHNPEVRTTMMMVSSRIKGGILQTIG